MYELGHLGLYKNVPKKRMFNSTPNYERDSYSLLQYKSHLRNEFLIPLKADGDGTGVATIYLQSTESQEIKITGSGRFYTDAQGTTGESTSAVVGTDLTTLYVKLNTGSCYLVLTKADKLSGLGSDSVNVITEATNAPFINGCNLGYTIHNLITIRLVLNTKSFFTGSIGNCPNLIRLDIYGNLLCSFTGSIDNCPNLGYFVITGNILCAFTGSLDSCQNVTRISISGNTLSNIDGDIGKAILCNYFDFTVNTSPITYVTRRSDWISSLKRISIPSASMTTEMVDNLFIDIDSSGVPAATGTRIDVSGLCAPVSSASLAARNSLVAKGYTLVYNNA